MLGQIGRIMLLVGLVLAALGGLILLFGRLVPSGRLPGDIVVRRPGFTFYFPLAKMIAVSILLSGILWLISYLRH
jgi:hypothetical protein